MKHIIAFLYKKWFFLAPAIMLFLAIPDIWSYGYYQILRIVVSIVAGYVIYLTYENGQKLFMIIMIAVLITFNPFFPVYFEKEVWAVIDAVVAIIFLISSFMVKTKHT